MNTNDYEWKKVGENDLEIPAKMLKNTKGKLNYQTPNTWMGYGILPFEEIMAIDVLPFMAYGELIAKKNGGEHTIIIADDLLKYNMPDMSFNEIRDLGKRKKEQLEKCKEAFKLENVVIENWRTISENDNFQDIKTALIEFYEKSEIVSKKDKKQTNYKEKVKKCLPKRIRDTYPKDTALNKIPEVMYAIDEIAATIYMSEKGISIKIGHELEKSYDKRTLAQYGNGFEKEQNLKITPSMIYLHGGYTTDTQDLARIMVPYITPNTANRIILKDSVLEVKEKLNKATQLYQNWSLAITETLNPKITETKDTAKQIYETLIKPITGVREYA
jgi:hypothetical protein